MNFSVRSKPFLAGTVGGIVLFAALNLWVYFASHCHHCGVTIGFPLPIHVEGIFAGGDGVVPYEYFYPANIVINLLLISLTSLGIGVVLDIGIRRFRDWRMAVR